MRKCECDSGNHACSQEQTGEQFRWRLWTFRVITHQGRSLGGSGAWAGAETLFLAYFTLFALFPCTSHWLHGQARLTQVIVEIIPAAFNVGRERIFRWSLVLGQRLLDRKFHPMSLDVNHSQVRCFNALTCIDSLNILCEMAFVRLRRAPSFPETNTPLVCVQLAEERQLKPSHEVTSPVFVDVVLGDICATTKRCSRFPRRLHQTCQRYKNLIRFSTSSISLVEVSRRRNTLQQTSTVVVGPS